jgi:hypothetical protein
MDEFAAFHEAHPAPAKPERLMECPHCHKRVGEWIDVYEVRQGVAGMWTILIEDGKPNDEPTYGIERRCSCGYTYAWRTSKPHCRYTPFE